MEDAQYIRLDPHATCELSSGHLLLYTYDPTPQRHETTLTYSITLYNNTNFYQYLKTDCILSPTTGVPKVRHEIMQGQGSCPAAYMLDKDDKKYD